MKLDDITPVIITYNEAPNVGRALEQLQWAKDVVVVDSGSTDQTLELLGKFPNVRVFQKTFESHATQWRYGIGQTGISTAWVLGLDADLILPEHSVREIADLAADPEVAGYEAAFRYCILGRPLPRSIFPPRIVLFRRQSVRFEQDGHAHRVTVSGRVQRLRSQLDHDDRKPLARWLGSQEIYARLDRDKLVSHREKRLIGADRIRAWRVIAPIAVFIYCLFIRRLIFAGLPGWYYTYQRTIAELLLSLYLIEDRLMKRDGP